MTHRNRTYKLKANESPHAIYFTIVRDHESRKVVGMFLNSKSMEFFQWTTALMTSYTRQMATGASVEEVIAQMKESFDPHGDYVVPRRGTVNSVVHHLALILEEDEAHESAPGNPEKDIEP